MPEDSLHETDGPARRDWKWWGSWYKASTYQFMLGFGASTMGAAMLGDQRPGWIPSQWHEVAVWAFLASWGWWLWMTFPNILPNIPELDFPKPNPDPGNKTYLVLALLGTFLFRWQWSEAWAVVLLGPCAAVILWYAGRAQNSRPYLPIFVWIISGAAALALPWPNPQRFLAVLITGGAATALQGVFVFSSFYLRLRRKLAEGC